MFKRLQQLLLLVLLLLVLLLLLGMVEREKLSIERAVVVVRVR